MMIPFKSSQKLVACIVALMISCNTPSTENTNDSHDSTTITDKNTSAHTTSPSARPVHWTYREEGGPEGWPELSPVYAACGSGKSQSPINLLTNTGKSSAHWNIDYTTTTLQISHNEHVEELINNGHTIQVTPQTANSITYAGKVYHLKQFHFHTPSEHSIDGKHFPMETHFVHQADDESLAVIGVLVKEGSHNSNFDKLIRYLPDNIGDKKTHDSVTINIQIHVPRDLYAYHYIGSLTTPPCSENVQWLVLKNFIVMSKEQLAAFSSRLKNNSRPVQPVHGRRVTLDDLSAKD